MKVYQDVSSIILNINGEERRVSIRPADTLLRVIREELGLTGGKPGCENGDCGACTVLLKGKPVKACMILAVEVEGQDIVTVEGLSDSVVQRAFLEHGGFQCGYCTPGFITNAHALLEAHPDADEETIQEWLQSNICRCTGYEGIKNSIEAAKAAIIKNLEYQ